MIVTFNHITHYSRHQSVQNAMFSDADAVERR